MSDTDDEDTIHARPRTSTLQPTEQIMNLAQHKASHTKRQRENERPDGASKRMRLQRSAKVEIDRPPIKLKLKRSYEESEDELARPAPTARNNVREGIAKTTKPRREAFLVENSHLFLPLLPARNHIVKLMQTSGEVTTPADKQVKQPEGVKAVMKPYQLEGLNFLVKMHRNGMSAILGDEMGLGKTLQTLSLFQWIRENDPPSSKSERRPFLVVCPLSVLTSWLNETKKWTPSMIAHRMHGPREERHLLQAQLKIAKVDLVITTYEAFQAEQSWFSRAFVWRYVVLDEGHKIKNDSSQISHALQSLSAEYRLLVTGTPLQNNLDEAWALLHWLLPEVFTSDTQMLFKKSFDLTRGTVSTSVMDDLRRLLELIMLRRMKSSPGVDLGLPPKEEIRLFVPLTPFQREWYMQLLTKIDSATLQEVFKDAKAKEVKGDQVALADSGEAKGGMWKRLMNLVMQLRKVCSHPYLIAGAEPVPYHLDDAVRRQSGKFIVLDKLVDELVVRKKKKILIFSGFTHVLDLVEDLLSLKDANMTGGPFKFIRLDGSTARAKRNLGIRMFNSPETDFRVMLISTRAGGLGINLTSASDVVFIDEDWNPQVTLQAEARAHRIGQTQKVTVYKLCTKGTVEEQMIGRIQKKLYLSAKVTESMRNIHSQSVDTDEPQLGSSALKTLLRRGAQALTGPEISPAEMDNWTWQKTVEECQDRSVEEEVDEDDWLNKAEKVETTIFEGRRIAREKSKRQDLVVVELDRAARRSGKETTVMVDGYHVDKTSMRCVDWEAVPTLAGKDPRLADVKRERMKIESQDYCQVCWEGGELLTCSGCPRSYHHGCLDKASQKKARGMSFYCPQHECWECHAKTASAGGLIYRCRCCESGYCEDCLDWDKTTILGANIPEFERLGYSSHQAWFIECAPCAESGQAKWVNERWEEEQALMEAESDMADDTQLTFGSGGTSATISEAATPVATELIDLTSGPAPKYRGHTHAHPIDLSKDVSPNFVKSWKVPTSGRSR